MILRIVTPHRWESVSLLERVAGFGHDLPHADTRTGTASPIRWYLLRPATSPPKQAHPRAATRATRAARGTTPSWLCLRGRFAATSFCFVLKRAGKNGRARPPVLKALGELFRRPHPPRSAAGGLGCGGRIRAHRAAAAATPMRSAAYTRAIHRLALGNLNLEREPTRSWPSRCAPHLLAIMPGLGGTGTPRPSSPCSTQARAWRRSRSPQPCRRWRGLRERCPSRSSRATTPRSPRCR